MANTHLAPGPYAVVIPVDPAQGGRVIDWPRDGRLALLYQQIDCRAIDLTQVGELGFWYDEDGAVGRAGHDWHVNGRATWLSVCMGAPTLVPGTVVVTLHATDEQHSTCGLARELADSLADVARNAPRHDVAHLTEMLRIQFDTGPMMITLDDSGMPDGFWI